MTLVWYATDLPSARVERRTTADDWRTLADIAPDGAGRFEYDDHSVAAATRYAYRLAWVERDETVHSSEVWVDVPRLEFALRLAGPNPSDGPLDASFSLAIEAPATLELFDLNGRLLQSRQVGMLGPGIHSVRLSSEGLSAGVYAIRLRQDRHVAVRRAVVLR